MQSDVRISCGWVIGVAWKEPSFRQLHPSLHVSEHLNLWTIHLSNTFLSFLSGHGNLIFSHLLFFLGGRGWGEGENSIVNFFLFCLRQMRQGMGYRHLSSLSSSSPLIGRFFPPHPWSSFPYQQLWGLLFERSCNLTSQFYQFTSVSFQRRLGRLLDREAFTDTKQMDFRSKSVQWCQ